MLQTSNSDKEIDFYLRPHLLEISGSTTKGHNVLTSKKENKGAQDLRSLDQKLSLIPLPNFIENIKETKTTIIGQVSTLAITTYASILSRRSLTSSATRLYKIPSDARFFRLCFQSFETKFRISIEDVVRDSIQEEAPSEEVMKETLSGDVEGASLGGVVPAPTKSSSGDMVPDFWVVEQGDKPNQYRRGNSPCQKIQNVDDITQERSNLIDKEGEIGVVSNDSIMAQKNEKPEKGLVSKVSTSEKPAIVTSLTNLELIERPSRSYLDIPLHKTHSNGLVNGQTMSEPFFMNQQKPLGEIANSVEIPQSIRIVAEEGTISNNVNMATSSVHSESASSQSDQLVTSQCKSSPHSEIRHSRTKTYRESEGHPINIVDFITNDLMSLFQPVEEDEGQVIEDNRVVKALADLERCLKMPLKDISSSDTDNLLLLTALNFLSNLPLKDVTLSDGLKDIIDSMHKEFPSILCSFKQAFAITNKLAVLEAHWDEVAVTLASKISEAKNLMDEAQQKEAVLKERIMK